SLAGTMHYCFALSQHFESMSRCSGQLTSCGGEGLPRISSAPVSASRRLTCSGVPRRRRTLSEKVSVQAELSERRVKVRRMQLCVFPELTSAIPEPDERG